GIAIAGVGFAGRATGTLVIGGAAPPVFTGRSSGARVSPLPGSAEIAISSTSRMTDPPTRAISTVSVRKRGYATVIFTVCPRTLADGMMKLYRPSTSDVPPRSSESMRTRAPRTGVLAADTWPVIVIVVYAAAGALQTPRNTRARRVKP